MNWQQVLENCKSKDPSCKAQAQLGLELLNQNVDYAKTKLSKSQKNLENWLQKSEELQAQFKTSECKPGKSELCIQLKNEALFGRAILTLENSGLESQAFQQIQGELTSAQVSIDSQVQLYKQIQKENVEVNRLMLITLLSVIIMISLVQAHTKWKRRKRGG